MVHDIDSCFTFVYFTIVIVVRNPVFIEIQVPDLFLYFVFHHHVVLNVVETQENHGCNGSNTFFGDDSFVGISYN